MYVLLIITGLSLIGWAYFKRRLYPSTGSWVDTTGKIDDFEIGEEFELSQYEQIVKRFPIVQYSFEVAGKVYSSNRVSPERENVSCTKLPLLGPAC